MLQVRPFSPCVASVPLWVGAGWREWGCQRTAGQAWPHNLRQPAHARCAIPLLFARLARDACFSALWVGGCFSHARAEARLATCAETKPALDPYGVAVSDLVARAVHCCYGGHWAARLGGIAALECLVPRLPEASLPRLAPSVAKAVFAVLRIVPEHAGEEQQLGGLLQSMLARCGGAPPAAAGTAACPTAAATAPVGAVPTSSVSPGSSAEGPQLPPLVKQLMEIFVQHLLSSRSSVAVRGVASTGLQASAAAKLTEC